MVRSRQSGPAVACLLNQEWTPMEPKEKDRFRIVKLEERIAPSNANFPPGQFPSGNPAHAPGNSNPNENGGPKS